jgi:hypothetical protein
MNKINNKYSFFWKKFFYFKTLLLIYIITVPSIVISNKLNNIIYIGTNGFVYPNFATFSNGSLVIETSKDKKSYERVFFGITKEGNPLFSNNNFIISFNSIENSRKYSENFIITINNQKHDEYLMSIEDGLNIEVYDLNTKNVIKTYPISKLIGTTDKIDSLIQTGINYFDGNNYYLFYGYITLDKDFYLKKLEFKQSDVSIISSKKIEPARGKIASCYMTKQKYIICLIMLKFTNCIARLKAYFFNIDLTRQYEVNLNYNIIGSSTVVIGVCKYTFY